MKSILSLILVFLLAAFGTWYFQPSLKSQAKEKLWVAPPPHLEKFSFGYQEIVADLLWLRVIQDFDQCNKAKEVKYEKFDSKKVQSNADDVTNDLKVEVLKRLEKADAGRHKNCDYSWAFYMLDSITDLSPRFRIPYASGATTLSVLIEDYEGAHVIFDKAIKSFPKDWPILYRAAYHYLYDRKDVDKAAELLGRAADNGAPIWLKSLAARLYTLSGQAEVALGVLGTYLKSVENPLARKEIEERIRVLQQIIAEGK